MSCSTKALHKGWIADLDNSRISESKLPSLDKRENPQIIERDISAGRKSAGIFCGGRVNAVRSRNDGSLFPLEVLNAYPQAMSRRPPILIEFMANQLLRHVCPRQSLVMKALRFHKHRSLVCWSSSNL